MRNSATLSTEATCQPRLRMRGRVCALALALLAAAPATGQETRPGIKVEIDPTNPDRLLLSVDETSGLELKQFIKLAEELTKKTFTFSEQDIANAPDSKIFWVGVQPIHRDNFFAFFQTMLYIKGFAILPHGADDTEVIEIIHRAGPKRADLNAAARFVPPEEIPSYANQTGVQILTSVPLTFVNANMAQNQLRPFFVQGGAQNTVTFGAAGQALLMQGFGPQVFAAYHLLQLVDVPADLPEQEYKVVQLQHASADELEPILTEILEDRARRQQQAAAQGAAGGEVRPQATGELKVVPHSSLNAILLSGTRDQVIEGQELIASLDVPIDLTGGDAHVIRLRNVLADDLYETLNRFIQEDIQSERTAQGAQPAATTARQQRKTVVVPHRESNSLLVSGTASKFKQLQRVIDELDRRQPQVLVECAVVELTTREATRLGIELGLIDIAAGDFTRPFGFTSFGLTTFEDLDGDGIPDTRLPDFENPLQGFTGGIISSDDFAIPFVVNALASNDHANILSLPSVVVNNNEVAVVVNQESRPTQQVSQGTATTQSGAGEQVPAGITLNISPSISTNNYLRLNVDLTVSRFTTAFDPNAVTAGVIAERQIATAVTMPSGHTMVLGGVIQDQQVESNSGIPILKDIPIVGWLFSSWSTDNQKTNLYFFLTPHILDEEDFSDLAEQSFRKKLEAAEYIGHRRIQIFDRKWREGRPETLEDPGATLEDIDARGGFDIPFYSRPAPSGPAKPTGPQRPDENTSGAASRAPTQPDENRQR